VNDSTLARETSLVDPDNEVSLASTYDASEINSSLTSFENTLEIFINLSVGRVHYKTCSKNLYFVDAINGNKPVEQIYDEIISLSSH